METQQTEGLQPKPLYYKRSLKPLTLPAPKSLLFKEFCVGVGVGVEVVETKLFRLQAYPKHP